MFQSKSSARSRGVGWSLLAAAGAAILAPTGACVPDSGRALRVPDGEVGMIVLMLTTTPTDVQCIRVALDDPAGSTKLFPATPGHAAALTFDGISPGTVHVAEDAFNVACTAVGAATAATWVSEMPVAANVVAGQSTQVSITLRPTGALRISNDFEGAGLSVVTSSVDFGTVAVGAASSTISVVVKNTATASTGTITAVLSGATAREFTIGSGGCTRLAAGASCSVTVVLRPATPGAKAATLTFSASPGGSATVSLAGVALTAPLIVIAPAEIDFGTVAGGTRSGPAAFSVTNTGETPASGLMDSLGSLSTEGIAFLFATDSCSGGTLAPGATCTISVIASPDREMASHSVQSAVLTVTPTTGAPGRALVLLTVL